MSLAEIIILSAVGHPLLGTISLLYISGCFDFKFLLALAVNPWLYQVIRLYCWWTSNFADADLRSPFKTHSIPTTTPNKEVKNTKNNLLEVNFPGFPKITLQPNRTTISNSNPSRTFELLQKCTTSPTQDQTANSLKLKGSYRRPDRVTNRPTNRLPTRQLGRA